MNYETGIKKKESFTLIEVLVGTFLILIVFLGIFTAYRLGLRVVGLSKNKITAVAIANQEIEKLRNLPYQSIGVEGSYPDGILEASSQVSSNNVEYTVERRVDYGVDSADGLSPPDDDCPNDYKKVEINVSWPGVLGGTVEVATDISPKSLAQECAEVGGILSTSVFDAYGAMVPSPLIEIKDPATGQILKSAVPFGGKHSFILASSVYKVVVSKSGYSGQRTYSVEEITTPENPHPTVLEGQLTEMSFSIDKVSSFSADTLSPQGADYFSDTFSDSSKVSESLNVDIFEGEVNLTETGGQYQSSGYLDSIAISPESLTSWVEFSFSDQEPANSLILYQILYFDVDHWVLIPDNDLAGNSSGFGTSPVNLSVLDVVDYPQLQIKGSFSTDDPDSSPTLYDWQVSWETSQSTPIPNVTFHLRGEKIIGLDNNDEPVYKYSQDHISNSSGHKDIASLEWDLYTFSLNPASGLDLVEIIPSPQPVNLAPNTNLEVGLYLEGENSLLVTAQDIETLEPIFSATVRLSNAGLDYDVTQYTDEKGQTYFIPLEEATFNLELQAPGYLTALSQVLISGDNTKTIKLERVE